MQFYRVQPQFCCLVTKSCPTLCNSMDYSPRAPLSMGFPRQEYWSGLPFPSPGNLPNSGIEPLSPALAGRFFTTEPPGKPTEFCRRKQHLPLCSQIWTMVTETHNKGFLFPHTLSCLHCVTANPLFTEMVIPWKEN